MLVKNTFIFYTGVSPSLFYKIHTELYGQQTNQLHLSKKPSNSHQSTDF